MSTIFLPLQPGNNATTVFPYIETLNVYCYIYSKIHTKSSIMLSVQSGWSIPENSSKFMISACLDDNQNPYLHFLQTEVLPPIKAANPQIVFLQGRPGMASFSLAKLIKNYNPSIRTCITKHSSEYYSTNKIDYLLVHNTYLFEVLDLVILENFDLTEKAVIDTCLKGRSFDNIPNVIYMSEKGKITHTGYKQPSTAHGIPIIQRRSECAEMDYRIAPSDIVNVHLFPNMKCYWNKCNFCGINQKYHFENPADAYQSIDQQLKILMSEANDAHYIWFIDEALPPHVLRKIANFFLKATPHKESAKRGEMM